MESQYQLLRLCLRVWVMSFLFTPSLFAQSSEQLDSLAEAAKAYLCVEIPKADSLLNNIYQQASTGNHMAVAGKTKRLLGYNKMCSGDLAGSKPVFHEAIKLLSTAGDEAELAKAYKDLASAQLRLSELDSARIYGQKFMDKAISLNDSVLIAAAYQAMCGYHTMRSNNDSVVYYAIEGLKYLEHNPHLGIQSSLVISIGNAHYQNEDYLPALESFREALRLIESSDNQRNLILILYNLATSYTKTDQYDSAIHYYGRCIELSKQQGRKYLLTYSYQGLGNLYLDMQDYEQAIKYNLLSKALSEELNEKRSLGTVMANLVACYVKTSKYPEAIQTGESALAIFQEIGDRDKEADAHFLLSEAYEAVGDWRKSLAAYKSFYSIDSSLISADRSQIIGELQTKYETEQKEAKIAALSQQATIQALELQQKNQWIIIGLIGFVLVGSIAFFYTRSRSIQKERAKTELEQRFLRSQLNPHFISNGLMAVQNFMLKNETTQASTYLAKFSKLMRQILENSRQEFITVEEEVQMLKDYMDIHQLRMNHSFTYQINIDENIDPEQDTIPPMFVQPFIENAIEHGIADKKENGLITLNFQKAGQFIGIEILDNGKGLESAQAKTAEHKSLSTRIIRERMELFNQSLQNKIELVLGEVRSDNGEIQGTRVNLKVPYSYA